METVLTKHRRSLRLRDYDYSQTGGYFVTICTRNHQNFFENEKVQKIVKQCWCQIPWHFPNAQLDEWIIMPNHLHGIILINPALIQNVGVQHVEPLQWCHGYQHIIPGSLGIIIHAYKAAVTRECRKNGCNFFSWQRNYYEHVVRNETELNRIREYIRNNPLKWELDRENPQSKNFNLEHNLYWKEVYER